MRLKSWCSLQARPLLPSLLPFCPPVSPAIAQQSLARHLSTATQQQRQRQRHGDTIRRRRLERCAVRRLRVDHPSRTPSLAPACVTSQLQLPTARPAHVEPRTLECSSCRREPCIADRGAGVAQPTPTACAADGRLVALDAEPVCLSRAACLPARRRRRRRRLQPCQRCRPTHTPCSKTRSPASRSGRHAPTTRAAATATASTCPPPRLSSCRPSTHSQTMTRNRPRIASSRHRLHRQASPPAWTTTACRPRRPPSPAKEQPPCLLTLHRTATAWWAPSPLRSLRSAPPSTHAVRLLLTLARLEPLAPTAPPNRTT